MRENSKRVEKKRPGRQRENEGVQGPQEPSKDKASNVADCKIMAIR